MSQPQCRNCKYFERNPNTINYLRAGTCTFKMPGWEYHLYRPEQVNWDDHCDLFTNKEPTPEPKI